MWAIEATTHIKPVVAATAAVTALAAAALSSGEIVTIAVSTITVAGGVFGSLMAGRARRYELALTREESEIGRLRADLKHARQEFDELDDQMRRLEKRNVDLWVIARILKGQLEQAGIEPAAKAQEIE